MMRWRFVPTLVVMLVFLGLVAPVAEGYIGQAPVQILMAGPSGPVKCGTTVTISATVLGAETGKPIGDQIVHWTLSGGLSAEDRLARSQTKTNSSGVATVDLQLGPYTGRRTVTASVTIVDGHSQVMCLGQLPPTSLERPGAPVPTTQMDAPMTHAEAATLAAPGNGRLAQHITIPRLGISVPIVQGNGVDVPATAVAQYPNGASPGEGSNTFLYGHARTGVFLDLWRVRTHDLVEVTLASGDVARYEVTQIVPLAKADDLGYMAATDGEELTLQTCLWYDDDSPRFVVIARPLTQGS